MKIMIVYVLIVVAGEFLAYAIGSLVDRFSSVWSLPVFLILFFGVLAAGWVLAVQLTEPRTSGDSAARQ